MVDIVARDVYEDHTSLSKAQAMAFKETILCILNRGCSQKNIH